jgi:outer membrane immunogenic protein
VRISIAAVAAALAIGASAAAHADGYATRGAPSYAPFSWTGFYAGANVGSAWIDGSLATSVGPTPPGVNVFAASVEDQINAAGAPQRFSSTGLTGGAQLGHNWQKEIFVFGFEVDVQGVGLHGSNTVTQPFIVLPANTYTLTRQMNVDWFATARGRLGVAVGRVLFYGTGGLAVADTKTHFTFSENFLNSSEVANSSQWMTGWTAGGGFEYALGSHLTFKTEYLYLDFGSMSSSGNRISNGPSDEAFAHRADLTMRAIRAGLNYKF